MKASGTPMSDSAFDLSEEEKVDKIEAHFRNIMDAMGMDLEDESLKGTPKRVAKMYVYDLFKGLDPGKKPDIKLFHNRYQYEEILIEKDITLFSFCEHHFVPIIGKAHVGYISNGKVIGLSKINRLVQYFAKRPQVQERLTEQIADELKEALDTDDVAVLIDATHMCISLRGIEDSHSSTVTSHFGGRFKEKEDRDTFLRTIGY